MQPAQLAQLRPLLREDFADVVLGSILLVLGLAALGLGAVRARSTSRPLICLGVANFLYGLRLILETDLLGAWVGIPELPAVYLIVFITYVMPLPAILFAEWALGRGWLSSIRLALYVQTAYAAGAILIDAVRDPGTAMGINNLMVLFVLGILILNGILHLRKNPGALRAAAGTRSGRVVIAGSAVFLALVINENLVEAGLVPWEVSPEPVGILALGGAIVYAFAHRVFANERRLAAISQELETARRIQSSILPRKMPEARGIALAARYHPMADVGGDFYDFLVSDPGLGILVADVSGHGVPAALIASMVKIALAAQAEHAADPAAVLAGMNRILHGHLERGFVTAAYIYIDTGAGTMVHASAGHPPVLLWREAERRTEEVRQESLPLGRFRKAVYSSRELRISPGDRLLLYTDGVTEAVSPAGEPFGDERLRALMASSSAGPDGLADNLLGRLSQWTGRDSGEPCDDDVTLVVAEVWRDRTSAFP
ncbi:MAG TPA: PP2C family protein-serine/threonine phosphatase [Thermoanaerobaculia bacterium]|nr:PP2C family protein-serine/threonine phosphatase [Thermoanaerobaculia bacterium]